MKYPSISRKENRLCILKFYNAHIWHYHVTIKTYSYLLHVYTIEYLASSLDSSVIALIPSRIEPVASLQGLRLSANEELRTRFCCKMLKLVLAKLGQCALVTQSMIGHDKRLLFIKTATNIFVHLIYFTRSC